MADRSAPADALPVNRRCAEGLHLWCPTTAGRFGRQSCGCPCHVTGTVCELKRVA